MCTGCKKDTLGTAAFPLGTEEYIRLASSWFEEWRGGESPFLGSTCFWKVAAKRLLQQLEREGPLNSGRPQQFASFAFAAPRPRNTHSEGRSLHDDDVSAILLFLTPPADVPRCRSFVHLGTPPPAGPPSCRAHTCTWISGAAGMEIGTLFRKHKVVEEETLQKKRKNEEENSSSCSGSSAEYECIMDGLEFAVHPYDIGQGGFIMVPFVRYNDFHVCAKKHMSSAWHKSAEIDATNFLTSRNVFETNFACQLDSSINRIVNENRKKLYSILSTIVFCGTHDIPLHGETKTGNMQSLLAFRVEAGDVTLREHLENEAGNARDVSSQIENELIKLCVDAIREEIVSAANGSAGFSVLVGESTEISGEDHLSLGIRFVDVSGAKPQVREEFLGFAALKGATCTAKIIIEECTNKLEPVTQALQTVQLDMMKVYEHIQELLSVFRGHREKAEEHFKGILLEVQELADKLGVDLHVPKQSNLPKDSNASVPTKEEYFRQSLYIPYLNSVISWLESRFAPESKAVFGIFSLHPKEMAKIGLETLKTEMDKISELYEIENLETETVTWFEKWLGKKEEERVENGESGLLDLLQYVDQYPSIQQAILIALALPLTTCTMEKSFSTMKRIETWSKSAVVDKRTFGLCMMSAHRVKINDNKDVLLQKVIDRFGEDNRRLQFLFEK
ncbi:52 kDa repressor of the inhibitor of the protein kinase-like [Crotalus adamanteus]|uniref:52 kDa repressor of the inhibitor of the protein kinase-like n=1 Tax=Crotalus adamanteus TaxID=8729 RepID=A0AAW1BX77_CROAD